MGTQTGVAKMKVKMIEGLHLTATNKRHIAEMLAKGMMEAGNKTFGYVMTNIEGNIARLTVIKRETDDQGRRISRKGAYVVEFSA
jgi:hypothetical protein